MGRNINQLLLMELENLEKDPDSRRAAMKALKSYVKDLDPKIIPMFLARASEIKDLGSPSGECMISLFEVLVRSHGRNIVPHIDNIMDSIVKTLSSAGSFALHQSCSKVVPALARYGIDPLMLDTEKGRIISSISNPLLNMLMGSQDSAASGAALCLRALVESDNWRFTSDDMVNEVCLKVAGALEEIQTQTTSHMGLVMALSQHNSFVVDAYARSLIRSGLQILTANVKDTNSQKRLSAIQMINSLMKCVDSRSISSEIGKIVEVMENSQNDPMPFVRGAAFEALQIAKIVAGQKGSRHEMCSSPFMGLNFDGRIDMSIPQIGNGDSGDAGDRCGPAKFSPAKLPTRDSFAENDSIVQSPLSLGQSSCNFEHGRRATRRLCSNMSSFDAPLQNGVICQAESSSDRSIVHSVAFRNGELSEKHREHPFSGSIHPDARKIVVRPSTPSPQRSRPQVVRNDNIYSTPRRLNKSVQNSSSVNFGDHESDDLRLVMGPDSVEVEWNPRMVLNKAINPQNMNMNCAVEGRVNRGKRRANGLHILWDDELATNGNEMTSTPCICLSDCDHAALCRVGCKDEERVQVAKARKSRYGKIVIRFFWFLVMVFIAVILSAVLIDNNKVFSDVVPT